MICDPTELNIQFFWHFLIKLLNRGISLAIQWLRLPISTPRGAGTIRGWGTKIPHATAKKFKNKEKKLLRVFFYLKVNSGFPGALWEIKRFASHLINELLNTWV